jgi:hypothetical protein
VQVFNSSLVPFALGISLRRFIIVEGFLCDVANRGTTQTHDWELVADDCIIYLLTFYLPIFDVGVVSGRFKIKTLGILHSSDCYSSFYFVY